MLNAIETVKPADIEKRSFEIITGILGDREFPAMEVPVVKRVIHASADFEYADTLKFSDGAVQKAMEAIASGRRVFTDTKMAAAGISSKTLARFGGQVTCLIDDPEVAREAKGAGITRSAVCAQRYAALDQNGIFVVGNAPTALIRLTELIEAGIASPSFVVGVPVGFVNVVESKEMLMKTGVPFIVSQGRKGGSNVAAAILNAILYMMADRADA